MSSDCTHLVKNVCEVVCSGSGGGSLVSDVGRAKGWDVPLPVPYCPPITDVDSIASIDVESRLLG